MHSLFQYWQRSLFPTLPEPICYSSGTTCPGRFSRPPGLYLQYTLVTLPKRPRNLDWWSLKPLVGARVPEKHGVHPVDAFINVTLRQKKLKPAKEADALTLIRRLTYDMTGLPPTPEQVDRTDRIYQGLTVEQLEERKVIVRRLNELSVEHDKISVQLNR